MKTCKNCGWSKKKDNGILVCLRFWALAEIVPPNHSCNEFDKKKEKRKGEKITLSFLEIALIGLFTIFIGIILINLICILL